MITGDKDMNNRLPKLNRKTNILLTVALLVSGALIGGGYYIHEQSKDIRELAHKPGTTNEEQATVSNTEGGGIQEDTMNATNEPSNLAKSEVKKDYQNTSRKNNQEGQIKKDDVVDNKSLESISKNVGKDDRVNTSSKSTTQHKSTKSKQSTPYNARKSDNTNSKVNQKSTARKRTETTHNLGGNSSKSSKRTVVYDADLTNATWNAWNNYRENNGMKRLIYSQSEASRSYNTAKEDANKQIASHGYFQCGMMAPIMSANGIINSFASSEGHRENLLDGHSIYGGVAVFKSSDDMIYCVLSFSDGW